MLRRLINNVAPKGPANAYMSIFRCHPLPGPPKFSPSGPSLASQPIEVEFFGHGFVSAAPYIRELLSDDTLAASALSAHAAHAPWEAQNALDAAFLAYSAVSVLRQQIHPSNRVHGIVTGKDWEPNGISLLCLSTFGRSSL